MEDDAARGTKRSRIEDEVDEGEKAKSPLIPSAVTIVEGFIAGAVDVEPLFAIDFGTNYSRASVWQDERIDIVEDKQGDRHKSSTVFLSINGSERVYEPAARSPATTTESIVYRSKRLLGARYGDESTTSCMKQFPNLKIVARGDRPVIELATKNEKKRYSAEEIVAMHLSKMKESAEDFMGGEVKLKNVVISVPVSFSRAQRQALKDAATIAGMNVVRLVSDPAAAAVAYAALGGSANTHRTALVVDVGASYESASIIAMHDGAVEVKASTGQQLGGEDFTERFLEHLLGVFQSRYKRELASSARSLSRLRAACELAKHSLSFNTEARIEVDAIFQGIDFVYDITRALFEELTSELLVALMNPIEQLLASSGYSKETIDEVILIGGASRMPALQQRLAAYGKVLSRALNVDEAKVFGAAMLFPPKRRASSITAVSLTEVSCAALSLFVDEPDGQQVLGVAVTQHAKLPYTVVRETTLLTGSTTLRVCEGSTTPHPPPRPNGKIKEAASTQLIAVADVSAAQQIKVTLSVDESDLVKVRVEGLEGATATWSNMTVDHLFGLADVELARLTERAARRRTQEVAARRRLLAKNALENYAYTLRKAMRDLEKTFNETQQWLEAHQSASEEEYNDRHAAALSAATICMMNCTKK